MTFLAVDHLNPGCDFLVNGDFCVSVQTQICIWVWPSVPEISKAVASADERVGFT